MESASVEYLGRKAACVVSLGLFLAFASQVEAQPGRPDPLARISKVTVLVSFNSTGSSPNAISEARLQTIVELRLRSAGMRVLTEEEDLKDPDLNPYIYLRVSTLETKNQRDDVIGYSYRLDLSARVWGTVPLNQGRAPMELWADETLAVASRSQAPAAIESIVNALTDSFLNQWLKANPRP